MKKIIFLFLLSIHILCNAQVPEDVYVAIYKSSNESEAKTVASQAVKPSKLIKWNVTNEWLVGTGPFSSVNDAQIYANEISENYKKTTGNQFPYVILRFKKNTSFSDLNSNNILQDEIKNTSNNLPQTYTYSANGFMKNIARCNVEVKVPGVSDFDVIFQDQPFTFTFTVPPTQSNNNLKISFIGKLKFLANIQPCNFRGEVYLNEIIANEWKYERSIFIRNSNWANRYNNVLSNVNYCLNVGFTHFGMNFSEDGPYDSTVLYVRPSDDRSKKIFKACDSIIDKQQYLENNVPCTIIDKGNNINTVCDKSLYTASQGIRKVDFKQAVIASLNSEDVKIGSWETKQAEEKRLALLEQQRKVAAAAEAQRLWRETPEGKKAQAEEDARLRRIALEEEAKERERKLANERYRKEQEAKDKITAENCKRATGMSVGAAEQMATALKVSVSGIKLLRTESFGNWCSAIVDTPKGIKRCKSEVMIKGNDAWVHFTPFLDCN